MRFASFYPSRLLSNRKIYRPIFLHLAPKRQRLKHHFAPFYTQFQSIEALFRLFCALHIIAFALRFGAFYPAFWCILPHILLQKAWCGAQNVYLNRGKRLFIHLYTHLVLPQTSWRNTRKIVGEQRIGWKNRSHNVKFRAQNVTLPCRCFRQHHIISQ